eukprot:scaffold2244_cov363-Pavlova_lutheri.AAC.8
MTKLIKVATMKQYTCLYPDLLLFCSRFTRFDKIQLTRMVGIDYVGWSTHLSSGQVSRNSHYDYTKVEIEGLGMISLKKYGHYFKSSLEESSMFKWEIGKYASEEEELMGIAVIASVKDTSDKMNKRRPTSTE